MSTYYLAISTGPIVDTLLAGQATREVWTASYLLSNLMKQLVVHAGKEIKGKDGKLLSPGGTVLSPVSPQLTDLKKLFGAGVFPDRMYAFFELDDPTDEDLTGYQEAIIDAAIDQLAEEVNGDSAFFLDYFRIVAVWLSEADIKAGEEVAKASQTEGISTHEEGDKSENSELKKQAPIPVATILQQLNDVLDTQELQPAYLKNAHASNGLVELLKKPYAAPLVRAGLVRNAASAYQGLTEAEFYKKDKSGKYRYPVRLGFDFFPSTAQIASLELYHRYPCAYYWLLHELAYNQEAGKEKGRKVYHVPGLVKSAEPDEADATSGKGDDATASRDVLMEFYRQLENKGPSPEAKDVGSLFQDYHKYFCIVHADGDQFGKVITALGNDPEKITKFSGQLADFATDAARIINSFGGKPIYIGGDDLLFFAPVVFYRNADWFNDIQGADASGKEEQNREESVTVFDLITALDDAFKELPFVANKVEADQPTLSYGLTLSHYKYPLFEARDASYNRLMAAKKCRWIGKKKDGMGNYPEKNAIAFRLIRHTGSYFDGYLDKDLLGLWNDTRKYRQDDQDFLSSFTYKLRELQPLLEAMGTDASDPQRIKNIIDNFFDEPIHGSKRDELDKLVGFHLAAEALKHEVEGDIKSTHDNAYALMRLMAFTLPKKEPAYVD